MRSLIIIVAIFVACSTVNAGVMCCDCVNTYIPDGQGVRVGCMHGRCSDHVQCGGSGIKQHQSGGRVIDTGPSMNPNMSSCMQRCRRSDPLYNKCIDDCITIR